MTAKGNVSPNAELLLGEVRSIVEAALGLGPKSIGSTPDSGLLGSVPELDSMAVVYVITALEERFGFDVEDDDISAETFATLGTLTEFVEEKLTSK